MLRLLPALLVALAIVAAYADAIVHAAWKQDDFPAFLRHPAVQGPLDLHQIAVAPYFGDAEHVYIRLSRPVATLTFALEKATGHDSPLARYGDQLLLYVLCGIGVTLLAQHLAGRWRGPREAAWLALGTGLLFAWHPAHVEVLMMAAYRPELLALLGELVALRLALLAADGRARWPHVVLSALALVFALWSKEQALMLLPVVAVWALTDNRLIRRLLPMLAAWGLVVLGWLVWRQVAFGGLTSPEISAVDNPLAPVDAVTRVRTALAIAARAGGHAVWPFDLAPDYTGNAWLPLPTWGLESVLGALGLVGVAVCAAWLWLRARQNPPNAEHLVTPRPLVGAALAWVLATWLPVSNLLFASTTLYADRLLFAPSVAMALVIPWLVAPHAPLSSRLRYVAPWVLAAVLGLWLLESRSVAAEWTTELRLFERGARLQPRSIRMQHNLALAIKVAAQDLPEADKQAALALAWQHHRAAWTERPDTPTSVALGLELVVKRHACDDGDGYARQLAHWRRPAVQARTMAIDWAMQCKKWALGWEAVRGLPPTALRKQQPLDVFALGVAAGHPDEAAAWARPLEAHPWQSPPWVSAATFGAEQAGRPDEALTYAARLHHAEPVDPPSAPTPAVATPPSIR